jgi:hypothetical protein
MLNLFSGDFESSSAGPVEENLLSMPVVLVDLATEYTLAIER